MHRLTAISLSFSLSAVLACGGKKPADDPSAKAETDSAASKDGAPKGDGEGEAAGGEGAAKKDDCVGFDISSLESTLLKSACEVPNASPDAVPAQDLKGKVDVTVSSSPTKVSPGGKADLVVAFVNKTKEPVTLSFRIDPTPRFEVEVYDKKNKRMDMPSSNPPPPPKDHSPPPPAEPKVAKVTIAANGSARQTIPWEAVKMAWAPEKVRGTPVERGFPRKPAGPLPKGKYTVKVVTPLVGATEEVSTPQVEIEIGG